MAGAGLNWLVEEWFNILKLKIILMKILFVARAKPHVLEGVGRFVSDQRMALQNEGIDVDLLPIPGKGLKSYFAYLLALRKYLKNSNVDLVHAHNGFTGFIVNLQRIKPTVVTYHGSDLNNKVTRVFSVLSAKLAAWNIFISEKIQKKSGQNNKFVIIPCGVDLSLFEVIDKHKARSYFGYSDNDKMILFAGNFKNPVKNYPLAKDVVSELKPDVKLIELKGFLRNEVGLLMNAVDAVLLTSFSEGSPQFIKEAMACNCPIVATNVGDIAERIKNVENCFVTSYDKNEIKSKLMQILEQDQPTTNGREEVLRQSLDAKSVAVELIKVYQKVLYGSK